MILKQQGVNWLPVVLILDMKVYFILKVDNSTLVCYYNVRTIEVQRTIRQILKQIT